MNRFNIKDKQIIGGNVLLLTLVPLKGREVFDFDAGQYVSIGFKRGGRRTPMRSFSIVSSPKNKTSLQVAMRLEGNFTRTTGELLPGAQAYVQGPFGEFTINPDYDHRVVLLAGGIGVTPFISMLRWAAETKLSVKFLLLYSCREQSNIPFYEELLQLQRQNPQFQAAFFITGEAVKPQSDSTMIHGPISEQHLQQAAGTENRGTTYFVCGPKGFMSRMEAGLLNQGVSPDRIVSESFVQSSKLSLKGGWTPSKLTYAFASLLVIAGVSSIMLLDLVRLIPKALRAQSASAATTQSSSTTSAASNTSNSTAASTETTTQQTTPTYQSYRQPVSSVS